MQWCKIVLDLPQKHPKSILIMSPFKKILCFWIYCSIVLNLWCIDHSYDPMSNKTPSKIVTNILVLFREVELVVIQLLRYLCPQSGFSCSQSFADIGSICSWVTDEIGVELSRGWSGETPPHEDGPEDSHSNEVVSCWCHSSVNKSWMKDGVPASHRLTRKAKGKVTAGMRRALTASWLCNRLNFINPSAVSRSSRSWSMKSWYYQWESLISEGLLLRTGIVSLFLSIMLEY